jgi:DNA (cytosine-5)-methyltransferase 1
MLPSAVQPGRFGVYESAVRRQEFVFGVAAPNPTEPGRAGKPRLAAPFCEWMMGCPPGWITDVVPRGDAIRIAGNGVVGQAVTYALPLLPTFPAAIAAFAPQVVAA